MANLGDSGEGYGVYIISVLAIIVLIAILGFSLVVFDMPWNGEVETPENTNDTQNTDDFGEVEENNESLDGSSTAEDGEDVDVDGVEDVELPELQPRPYETVPAYLLVARDGSHGVGEIYEAQELVLVEYDRYLMGEFNVVESFEPTNGSVASLETIGRHVFVAISGEQQRLVRLDEELHPSRELPMRGVESMASDDENLYVAAGHELYVFDQDLDQIGVTEVLPEESKDKKLEEMLVHGDDVYILDDVARPIYLFRMNVSDPTSPSLGDVFHSLRSNEEPTTQWLKPEENLWMFLGRSNTLYRGVAHTVYYTPLGSVETEQQDLELFDEKQPVRQVGGWEMVYSDYAGSRGCPGSHRINSVASPAGVANVTYGGKLYLAEFRVEDNLSGPAELKPEECHVTIDFKHEVEGLVHLSSSNANVFAVEENGSDFDLSVYGADSLAELERDRFTEDRVMDDVLEIAPGPER